MAKTYLELTNIALRDINEVALTSPQFTAPRGIQAAAKEMVNRAYADILNYSKEWPFLSEVTGSILSVDTVALQQEYSTSSAIDHIDWDSFFVTASDNSYYSPLKVIDIDYYNQNMKVSDLDLPEGGDPRYVYRLKSNDGFGLSPFPSDKGYTVTFSAWTEPTLLSAATDTVAFPERYYNVIISRARYYLWMFRENAQQAQFAMNDYERGIKQMHRDLVEKQSISMRAV